MEIQEKLLEQLQQSSSEEEPSPSSSLGRSADDAFL
jgi:hypothetical protein